MKIVRTMLLWAFLRVQHQFGISLCFFDMNLTLRQLDVYARVARARSFTAAAAELHVAQSVVSRTVSDVERHLGARLLSRSTRTVTLTPEGEHLLRLAEGVLRAHRDAGRAFDRYLRGDEGTVEIAALPSVAALLLPPVVKSFLAARPGVHLRILDVLSHSVLENVASGAADLGITIGDWLPDGLNARPLVSDRMAVLLPPDHRLCRQPVLTWTEVAREPVIALTTDSSVRALTDHGFAAVGATAATLIETGNIGTVGGLVAAGLGIALLPWLVHPLLSFAGLVTRPLIEPVMDRHLTVITRADTPLSPVASRFIAHLRHTAPAVAKDLAPVES
jgi:LysR family carnitine catabolism transcriptional activator